MRTKWEQRTRPHGRVELAGALYYWSSLWVRLLGALPIAIVMVVGVINGTADDGLFFPVPGYPAFTTLSAWLVVPALLLLASTVISVPLPLEDRFGPRRGDFAWLGVAGVAISLVSLVLDDGRPDWQHAAPYVAAGMFAMTVVIVLVRGLLAAAKLLPRSWRGTFRTDEPAA